MTDDDPARTVALTRLQEHLGVPLIDLPAVQLRRLADARAASLVAAYATHDAPPPATPRAE